MAQAYYLTREKKLLACGLGCALLMQYEHSKRHMNRRWWVRPWATQRRRQSQGFASNLVQELREEDEGSFHNFFRSVQHDILNILDNRRMRCCISMGCLVGVNETYFDLRCSMDATLFDEVLEKVKPYITKQNTTMRDSISAHDKLCVTLHFLASGQTYTQLSYAFRMSVSAIAAFVPEVCQVLYDVLKEEYMSVPSSRSQWLQLADEFESKWQFPHAVGAIDGKHINVKAPPNTGSEYFNYKKQFSFVLLAIADANAQFIAFDLGSAGSQSDGGIFKHGSLGAICKSEYFPPPEKVGKTGVSDIPYFILGDEAFALDQNLMKPYPHRTAIGDEKIFNYRLSRARRIVENAFGILCARFRVLLRTMELDVSNAMQVVRACLVLHNFLMTKKGRIYCPPGFQDSENEVATVTPGGWRDLIDNCTAVTDMIPAPNGRSSTQQAREVRELLKEYFFSEGAVDFQWARTE